MREFVHDKGRPALRRIAEHEIPYGRKGRISFKDV